MINHNSTDKEYFADSALSRSDLVQLSCSFNDWVDYKGTYSKPETAAMKKGSIIHTMLLEPGEYEERYAIYTGLKNRSSKEYKEFCSENPGKQIILEKESRSDDFLKRKFLETDVGKHIFEIDQKWKEFSVHLTYNHYHEFLRETPIQIESENFKRSFANGDIKLKVKIDCYCTERKTIYDVKTIASYKDIQKHSEKYGYYLQAYMYARMLEYQLQLSDSDVSFVFVFIDKSSGRIHLRRPDVKSLKYAENQFKLAIRNYQDSVGMDPDKLKQPVCQPLTITRWASSDLEHRSSSAF